MNKIIYDKLGYFQVLDVQINSPEDEIRQKYRELAKFWHPDHNTDPQAVEMFQKISIAYDVLKDAKLRIKYALLSLIYSRENFPNLDALSLIRNMHGQEDLNLRAFRLIEITGKGIGHNSIDKVYYCSPYEAAGVIGNISKHNWTKGFLGLTAFFANIKAIIQNITLINEKSNNLQLLIHNSLVYESEGKIEEAATLALLAKEYASKEQIPFIDEYLKILNSSSFLSVQKWNFTKLVQIQLVYPIGLLLILIIGLGFAYLQEVKKHQLEDSNLKQVVIFKNGQKTFSDVAVAKIFDIPVDIYDTQKLYHTIEETPAMHGADENFDVYKTVEKNATVRITGYTGDNKWYRVMFDNGEMAFIKANKLEQGIGNPIPLWSKIYKEN